MKYILKNIIKQALPVIICILAIASCNKTLERFSSPIATTQNSLTINDFLISDTNYSLLNALVIRAGLTATLSDKNNTFTLFAPNNAAFRAAGFTTTAIVSGLPVASAAGIAGYLLVPGREYRSEEHTSELQSRQYL